LNLKLLSLVCLGIPQSLQRKIFYELEVNMQEPSKNMFLRNIPQSVHRALKVRAAQEGKTMQGLILDLIWEHINSPLPGGGRKKLDTEHGDNKQ